MFTMRTVVVGAGAMGSTMGGRLASADNDVTLVDVRADHMTAVQEGGLTLSHADGREERIDLAATSDTATVFYSFTKMKCGRSALAGAREQQAAAFET